MMNFMPTGGITPENVSEYLKFPKVLACGGSWMVTKELLAAKQFEKITALSKQAVELAKAARPKS
jgi:2-dehydro-3-deoxyphosphogluconate aldolase/(4S)-4-hydroxy-2-oxoglutarate aldolase